MTIHITHNTRMSTEQLSNLADRFYTAMDHRIDDPSPEVRRAVTLVQHVRSIAWGWPSVGRHLEPRAEWVEILRTAIDAALLTDEERQWAEEMLQ